MAGEFETTGLTVGAGGATVDGVGVALRGQELDQATKTGTAFTSAGSGGWETVDTLAVSLSLDGSIMAVADLDAEAAAAAAVAGEVRLVIDGDAGGEIGVDLLATQDALPAGCNHLHAGMTAGSINVELQVKDDGVTAITLNHWSITALGLVQKG